MACRNTRDRPNCRSESWQLECKKTLALHAPEDLAVFTQFLSLSRGKQAASLCLTLSRVFLTGETRGPLPFQLLLLLLVTMHAEALLIIPNKHVLTPVQTLNKTLPVWRHGGWKGREGDFLPGKILVLKCLEGQI